jgi:hypothetical protein
MLEAGLFSCDFGVPLKEMRLYHSRHHLSRII